MTLVKIGIHPVFKYALVAGVPASAGWFSTVWEKNRLKAIHQRENCNTNNGFRLALAPSRTSDPLPGFWAGILDGIASRNSSRPGRG
jgi:hypothetical protein